MCIHRMLPNGQNIHLACSDPALIEAGRRLNSRCGFHETVLQLNTQAFPIISPPAVGPHVSTGASAVAAMVVADSTDDPVPKASVDNSSPQYLGQASEMVYYSGQIVQCPRCSLRFRSPQPCHSLVCPDCVLPIEENNVAAFMRANAQLLPNQDVAGALPNQNVATAGGMGHRWPGATTA